MKNVCKIAFKHLTYDVTFIVLYNDIYASGDPEFSKQ